MKNKRKKKRPTVWDRPDSTAFENIYKYIGSHPRLALGVDPGWRGIGVAICDFETARLLTAAAILLPTDDHEACGMFSRLVRWQRCVAIERQPGVAKRKVVRVEGWLFAAAAVQGVRAVYVQPRRKTDPPLDMEGDDEIIELIKPAALREHARSALWCIRRALQQS